MTVESYRAPQTNQSTPGAANDHEATLWHLLNFLSGSASWNIVDSWTETQYNAPNHTILGRYKGDPIADAQGWSPGTLNNGWGFVAEMASPVGGRPAMQIVFQYSISNFAPVSGDSYDHDGTASDGLFIRTGTQGDWDTETVPPDFTDPTKATDIQWSGWYHYGSGNDNRAYFSADDDWLILTLLNAISKEWNSIMWLGRYNAKSASQDTIASPAYAMVTENNGQRLDPDGFSGAQIFLTEALFSGSRILALDELGVMRDWPYHVTPGMGEFIEGGSTEPNEFDPTVGIDLHEVLVRGRGTLGGHDDRTIGSLTGVYAASRLGVGALFNGGAHLCLGSGYGCVIEWDGTAV
jgi:hypothetical protein